jgi:hypothetical protein
MKRKSIVQSLNAGMLICLVMAGCETPDPRPVTVSRRPTMPAAPLRTENKEVANLGSAAPATTPNAMESLPAPEFPASAAESTTPAVDNRESAVKQASFTDIKPAVPPTVPPTVPFSLPQAVSQVPVAENTSVSGSGRAENYANAGHAEDYSWLRGEVQYDHISKGWRLRYAGLDEADRWGGAVILISDSALDKLRDGQIIKVQGHMIDSENRKGTPMYRTESIAVMDGAGR